MIRSLIASLLLACAMPAFAQTLTVTAPLTDRDGDGQVTLTKAMPPFNKGDVLIQCTPLVYAKACTSTTAGLAVDPWTPRIPSTLTPAKAHKLEKPAGPIVYKGEAFTGSLYVFNRWTRDVDVLPANDLTIEGSRITASDSAILLTRDSRRTVIRDLEIIGAGDKAYKAGVKLDGTASDVLVERVVSRGFRSTQPKGYPNADGFATESGNARVTFRYVTALDNTDGGLDLKSNEILLDHVRAARNRYGVRLRVKGVATTLYLDSNTTANVYWKPNADWSIGRLELSGPVPKHGDLYQDGRGPARIVIGSCNRPLVIHAVAAKDATLVLGPGCTKNKAAD